MTLKDQINSRGWADGWHAQELEKRAKHQGRTMATVWAEETEGATAYNVPGRCLKIHHKDGEAWGTFQFIDGSTIVRRVRR